MIHIYKEGKKENAYTFLALHGTGGDEHDLISLVEMVAPDVNILSVRGNVSESGMARFFKRKAPGIFDMESLQEETNHLRKFLAQASRDYGFDPKKVIAFGYSNGANIAANILLSFDDVFQGAILLHPMIPNKEAGRPRLDQTNILITAGRMDTMVPYQDAVVLESWFKESGAYVELFSTDNGHQILQEEIVVAKKFFENNFS